MIALCAITCMSCKDHLAEEQPQAPPPATNTDTGTRAGIEMDRALYHEPTKSWVAPRKDPYSLENFRAAYANIVSSRSAEPLSGALRGQFSADTSSLQPTHYALKVYPRTEAEQTALELTEDIKVAYIPFDYTQLTEAETQTLTQTRSDATFPDSTRYTVVYENMESTEGTVSSPSYTMPILYVVWPCQKPLPAELDYQVDYPVFLPFADADAVTRSGVSLSEEAMQILEQEAITKAWNISPEASKPRTRAALLRTGYWYHYDNKVKKDVPMHNLKVRFQAGSSIWETYVKENGSFTVSSAVVSWAMVSFVTQHPRWTITYPGSTSPVNLAMGEYQRESDLRQLTFRITLPAYPAFEAHRAANYFYHGSHSAPVYYVASSPIHIEMSSETTGPYLGVFQYHRYSNERNIVIYNKNRNDYARVCGTVLHELGHYTHYLMRGDPCTFDNTSDLMCESFASYVGWHVGEVYYCSRLGYVKSSWTEDVTWQSRQGWKGASGDIYSPMLVDLIDTYNQKVKGYEYAQDPIGKVPHSVIARIARDCARWPLCKGVLNEYVGQHYTSNEFNAFAAEYDSYDK